MPRNFTHKTLWEALDRLADREGLSPSGLAKRAGLDATTFNPSKRSAQGRARWPSTESIAKVLEATDTGIEDFFSLLDEGRKSGRNTRA